MNPLRIWQGWSQEIGRIVPGLGAWQRGALALFSLGVASAKHCGLARVAAVVPGLATVPSTTRRFERLLANERLDVRAVRSAVAAHVLAAARGQTVWLALDETHQGHTETGARLGMLAVRLCYRERAIPLAWACYRPGEAEAPFPVLIGRLLAEVAALVPPDTRVVLMTDRGLSWPSLLDQCRRHGWSFLCRVQGSTRLRDADGQTRRSPTWRPVPAPAGRVAGTPSSRPAGGPSTSSPSGGVAMTSPGCSSPTSPRPGPAAPSIVTAWTRRRVKHTTPINVSQHEDRTILSGVSGRWSACGRLAEQLGE